MMITPTIKDDYLKWLCLNCEPESEMGINMIDLVKSTNSNFETLNAVLTYFQRIGFIHDLNVRRVATFLILRVEANDFLLRGGFVAQEELLEANIQKLLLEIESLKPSLPDKVEKIANISNAILTALSLFGKT